MHDNYVNIAEIVYNAIDHFYPPPVGEGGFKSRQDYVRRLASRFLVGAKT